MPASIASSDDGEVSYFALDADSIDDNADKTLLGQLHCRHRRIAEPWHWSSRYSQAEGCLVPHGLGESEEFLHGCKAHIDDSSQSVLAAMTKHLLKIKGFSEIKVDKVKDAAKKCLVSRLLSPTYDFSCNFTHASTAQRQRFCVVCRSPPDPQALLSHFHREQAMGLNPSRRLSVLQY